MIAAFWCGIAYIIYVYFFYPIILTLFAIFRRKKHTYNDNYIPKVSMIITAFNEESVIREKLENTLTLSYPKEKLEIIVVSDGSNDRTNAIVQEYSGPGVKIIERNHRIGKSEAQNIAVERSQAEIIVFSDANSMYKPDAVQKMVRHFTDPKVSCVCGKLEYLNKAANIIGIEESIYWKYETHIRKLEDQVGEIFIANGSIYAIRRERHIPLESAISSDFMEPLLVTLNGGKIVYESGAIATERPSSGLAVEFDRKQRIVLRGIYGLLKHRELLNIFKHPIIAFQLISHKLLRWFVPFVLIVVFALSVLISGISADNTVLFTVILLMQCFFYLLAAVGFFLLKRGIRSVLLFIPIYFCTVNAASLVGIIKYFAGKRLPIWETQRIEEKK